MMSQKPGRLGVAMLLCFLLAIPGAASAALVCTPTISSLVFGTLHPLNGASSSAVASLHIDCNGGKAGATVSTCLSMGYTSEANGWRTLLSKSNALPYNMFTDAAHTQVWGTVYPREAYPPPPVFTLVLDSSGAGRYSGSIYGYVPAVDTATPPGNYTNSYSAADIELRFAEQTGAANCSDITASGNQRGAFTISATVEPQCTVTTTDLALGSTGNLQGDPILAASRIYITCSAATDYAIAINAGRSAGATIMSRKLTDASTGGTVNYQLYVDTYRTQIWGDGTTGNLVSGTGTGLMTLFSTHATVPKQDTPPPGTYTDVLTVTVTY